MSILETVVLYAPAIVAFVGVLFLGVVILLVLVFSDRDLNNGNNFYPTSFQIFALNIKLFLAPLVKGSSWKKLVRQDNPELNSDALTRVIAFNPNIEHIKEFKIICKLQDDDTSIPFLYPAVVLLYPNCCLFAAPEYPFPAVGSVHIYNTTTLCRKLAINEKYSCILKANNIIKHAKKGSEVEFISNLLDKESKNVWTNSSKFLIMHNQRKKIKSETWTDTNGNNSSTSHSSTAPTLWTEPNLETDNLSLLFEDIWMLGPNASIEYAAVSKDFNPIHTSSIAAKAFGFPGIIMHGMFMITRAASECQRIMNSTQSITYPLEISTKFQRPCVLPQKCVFQVYSIKSSKQHLYFTVKGKNEKILLDGYLHCTSNKTK